MVPPPRVIEKKKPVIVTAGRQYIFGSTSVAISNDVHKTVTDLWKIHRAGGEVKCIEKTLVKHMAALDFFSKKLRRMYDNGKTSAAIERSKPFFNDFENAKKFTEWLIDEKGIAEEMISDLQKEGDKLSKEAKVAETEARELEAEGYTQEAKVLLKKAKTAAETSEKALSNVGKYVRQRKELQKVITALNAHFREIEKRVAPLR